MQALSLYAFALQNKLIFSKQQITRVNIKETSGLQLYNKNWFNKYSQDFLSQVENSYFAEHLSINIFLTLKKM